MVHIYKEYGMNCSEIAELPEGIYTEKRKHKYI
jgi:hypothetical protein